MIRRAVSSLVGLKPYKPSPAPLKTGESLARFTWRITGAHQIYAGFVAVCVAVLDFAPVDLQRRIIDGAIMDKSVETLVVLCGVYLAVVLLQAGLKYALQVYQSWLAESVLKVAREQLSSIAAERQTDKVPGQTVNVISSEIEQVCGFIGESISQAVVNLSFLVVIGLYLLWAEPMIVLFSAVLLLPQALLAPWLQSKLNRLIERQVGLVRKLGDQITAESSAKPPQRGPSDTIWRIYRNRMKFFLLKFGLKALLNFASAMAPLTALLVGGVMVINGQTTIGTVVAFVSGFDRIGSPMRDLLVFYRTAAQASVQHEMITSWMEGHQEPTTPASKPPAKRATKRKAKKKAPAA